MRSTTMVMYNQTTLLSSYTPLRSLTAAIFILLSLLSSGQTISPKKGISGDLLNNADCVVSDSLTWYYNWANTPNAAVIGTHQNYLEYCPMLWNGSWNPTALTNYLNAHPEVDYLLAFNEPNFDVQANMTPAQAAALWPQVEAIANTYNLKIVSPAMSYCTGTCIPGYNNLHGTVWLDDFFAACPGCRVDAIGLHIYDTWYHGFRGVADLYKKYNRPIWITEFDYSGAATWQEHMSLMVDVIDWMEKDPSIFRYAWFLTRSSPTAGSTDILGQTTGTLANLGQVYMYMSSYDELYYHNVNKIIEAEHYISKSVIYCNWNGSTCTWPYSVLLEPTTDVTGKLDAYHWASPTNYTNDTVYYNIDIPTTQTYSIDFRVSSNTNSTIQVRTSPGNVLLGTTGAINTGAAWTTITLNTINLSAGKQKIYLTAGNGSGLKLNWFRINCTVNCGLPVELQEFKVHDHSPNSAKLEWLTASEINSKLFIIERSVNGVDFDSIGTVAAAGHSSSPLQYSFTDTDAYGTLLYYRLKHIDIDGSFSYSPIETLNRNTTSITLVEQTIVTEFINPQQVSYILYTATGQVIAQEEYQAGSGVQRRPLSLQHLSDGIYFIKIISEGLIFTTKVVVNQK